MACNWCGNTTVRATARFCSVCAAPLLDGAPLSYVTVINFASGAWLRGRYQIRKLLGAGAMGTVFGALDNNLPGRRVAIKELDPQRIANPAERLPAAEMFRAEAQTLARLDHPSIPKVSDYFAEGERQYQVMDFIDGMTLEEILTRQRVIPEYQLLPWIHQVCDALNYLHTQRPPVIFRDLKPSNIMIDRNGRVKLIDFGIARTFKVGKVKDTQQMGTPGFAAPEQYGQGQTDARSDIYALCATMYAALSGYDIAASPFNLPPIRQIAPQVSPATERVISVGLDYNPANRWQTVQHMATQIPGAPLPPDLQPTKPALSHAAQVGKPMSSPTQKLGALIARWSNAQIAFALSAFTAVIAIAMYVLTPVLVKVPLFWNNVEFSALIAPLAYAAIRRRGAAGIAQIAIAATGGIITQNRLGYATLSAFSAILIAFVCGAFVEVWLLALKPQKKSSDVWLWELLWLMPLAMIVGALVRVPYRLEYWFNPFLALISLVLGGVGWFCGDLVQHVFQARAQKPWA